MTLPNTNLSIGAIHTEFADGPATPNTLSADYYRGGPFVNINQPTSVIDGVPIPTSAGVLIRIGMFRGLEKAGLVPTASTTWRAEQTTIIPVNPVASITFNTNGTTSLVGDLGPNTFGPNWFGTTVPGIGNSYWVRATQTASTGGAGSTLTGTLGSWLALSSNREWSLTATTTASSWTRTFTFEFSTSASGTPTVATHTNSALWITREN